METEKSYLLTLLDSSHHISYQLKSLSYAEETVQLNLVN